MQRTLTLITTTRACLQACFRSGLFRAAVFAATLLAPAAAVRAAELGDVTARSFIGQPLAADIELIQLAPDELNVLQARLARQDVYRGANITMNPALGGVQMAVVRQGARQYLHVTTARPVAADYVHLFVELSAAGRQDVRAATVWLQADPNPPPPMPPPTPPAPTLNAGTMTPADAERITAKAREDRAAAIAAVTAAAARSVKAAPGATETAPTSERSRPAPLPSVHESEIGVPGALRAQQKAQMEQQAQQAQRQALARRGASPAPVSTPAPVSVRALPEKIADALGTAHGAASKSTGQGGHEAAPAKPAAAQDTAGGLAVVTASAEGALPVTVSQALLSLPPLPLPRGAIRAPACTPANTSASASAKACAVLDNHNAALSSKLVELEGKLKALQGALGASAAASAAAGARGAVATQGGTAAAAHAAQAPAAAHTAAAPSASAHDAAPAASAPAEHKEASVSEAGGEHPAPASAAAATAASSSAAAASASAAVEPAAAAEPVKMTRVLPKLKYKKEKTPEAAAAAGTGIGTGTLIAAGAALLLALGGGAFLYRRRKKSAGGPLKIWQGFRKKKPADPATAPALPQEAAEPAAQ